MNDMHALRTQAAMYGSIRNGSGAGSGPPATARNGGNGAGAGAANGALPGGSFSESSREYARRWLVLKVFGASQREGAVWLHEYVA